jgi:hypothetical protein
MGTNSELGHFSPAALSVAFLGVSISGFDEDEFVKIEKLDEVWVTKRGADGIVCRVKKANKGYRVTITLMQNAKSNAYLSTIQNVDEAAENGAGVGPLTIMDTVNGLSVFIAGESWIVKPPDVTYGSEPKNRAWIFDTADGVQFVGGN